MYGIIVLSTMWLIIVMNINDAEGKVYFVDEQETMEKHLQAAMRR